MSARRPVKKRSRFASLLVADNVATKDFFEVDELSDGDSDSDWREEDCEPDDQEDNLEDDDEFDENVSDDEENNVCHVGDEVQLQSFDGPREKHKRSRFSQPVLQSSVAATNVDSLNDTSTPLSNAIFSAAAGDDDSQSDLHKRSALSGAPDVSVGLHGSAMGQLISNISPDELCGVDGDKILVSSVNHVSSPSSETFERDEIDTSSCESSAFSSSCADDLQNSSEFDEDVDYATSTSRYPDDTMRNASTEDGTENALAGASTLNKDFAPCLETHRSNLSPADDSRQKEACTEGGEEYAKFLSAILMEDSPPTAGPQDASMSLLDDDFDADFDYLTAAAQVIEDPLEYRNDRTVHVSRKELVQLVSGLPPRRRRHRKNSQGVAINNGSYPHAPVTGLLPPWATEGTGGLEYLAHRPSFVPARGPDDSVPQETHETTSEYLTHARPSAQIPGLHGETLQPATAPSAQQTAVAQMGQTREHSLAYGCFGKERVRNSTALLAPRPVAQIPLQSVLSVENIAILQHQINLQVIMLAHVHLSAKDQSSKDLTSSLLRDLLQMRDTSREYKNKFESLRRSHELPLHSSIGAQPSIETYFAAPALELAPAFLQDAKSDEYEAERLLERFYPFAPASIHKALMARSPPPKYSRASEAELPWTLEDDLLLAMTVAKHTVDFGDSSKDLLPHRETLDCERRMRYLSSRRCSDNLVKRQVHLMTINLQPLSKDEIELVKLGLKQYAGVGSNDDAFENGQIDSREVWKLIQRDLLPHRDWRQLQKTWGWRESRRRYKQKARQKQSRHP